MSGKYLLDTNALIYAINRKHKKSEPKRALIAIVATMLGGMLGVFAVFVREFVRGGGEE